MRSYVSLDFKSNLSDPALAQFTANVLTRLKTNPKFSSLLTLAETVLQPAFDRYSLALQEAADRSLTKVAAKRSARKFILTVLEDVAAHVNLASDNPEATILEAGFTPRRRSPRTDGVPEQVQGLRAMASHQPGEALLDYAGASHARGCTASSGAPMPANTGATASIRRRVARWLPVCPVARRPGFG